MKYGKLTEVKNIYPIPCLLSDDCIKRLELLFGIHISRQQQSNVNLPEEVKHRFYKKLMETVPGFDKGDK